jgi:hypothetical protein
VGGQAQECQAGGMTFEMMPIGVVQNNRSAATDDD